ncbi:unnamed protein product [Gongylonema pulchrum]|uniref:Fibronectin type-III domain-containing protein n=1 Tax=Gongylonema pulchrum TaxID=637853 RepID=A0A183DJR3_9BILA|nr:unnamed protein product [Gongylonema pulchrum]
MQIMKMGPFITFIVEELFKTDTFRISYIQLDPLRYFPKLEVYDIAEQQYIEIYLGNLIPGRDYNVSITPQMKDVEGRPWKAILTTSSFSV